MDGDGKLGFVLIERNDRFRTIQNNDYLASGRYQFRYDTRQWTDIGMYVSCQGIMSLSWS